MRIRDLRPEQRDGRARARIRARGVRASNCLPRRTPTLRPGAALPTKSQFTPLQISLAIPRPPTIDLNQTQTLPPLLSFGADIGSPLVSAVDLGPVHSRAAPGPFSAEHLAANA